MRSLGSPSNEVRVLRNEPSGRSRAIPDSAVPAQRSPEGETAIVSTWFEGRPEEERRIFWIEPDPGSTMTIPPSVPRASAPFQEAIDCTSFELT